MVSDDDRRLQGQDKALLSETLYWRQYHAYSDKWEHDHCAFCWEEFAERSKPNVLHEGYTTKDRYYWVCRECFDDFKEIFQWQVGCRNQTLCR